jgi:riboflavin synthase
MFTGIITETGEVRSFSRTGERGRIGVACDRTRKDLDIGDSVAVNGVCLTVVEEKNGLILFDAVGNTLAATNLGSLRSGDRVNLEQALRAGDPIGGHMVSGHIDARRKILRSRDAKEGWQLDIALSPGDDRYIVRKGSVAVDGVSLTVSEVRPDMMRIYLIPLTLRSCTLGEKRPGYIVNLEYDMMGKYAARDRSAGITASFLREKGFI